MIRTKNIAHEVLSFEFNGALTTSNSVSKMVPFAGFINNLYVGRVTGTLATTFDIQKNGSTIFAALPKVGTGGTISSTGTLISGSPRQVAAGDILTVFITDIGAGAPTDMVALITVSKMDAGFLGVGVDHNELL